jgi:hypothetical protein
MIVKITFNKVPLEIEGIYVPKKDQFGDTAIFEIDKVFYKNVDITKILDSFGEYIDVKLVESPTIKGVNIFQDIEQEVLYILNKQKN